MNSVLPQSNHSPSPWCSAALRGQGFEAVDGVFRRGSLVFRSSPQWFSLESDSERWPGDFLRGQLAQPGLWRWIPTGPRPVRIFEFPRAAVTQGIDDEGCDASEPQRVLDKLLLWAIASEHGAFPTGWTLPDAELLRSWLPAGGLTLQCGPLVHQGELIVDAQRWALRFPLFRELPTDLPPSRREWLEAVLTDAMTQWRMVRIGIEGENPKESVILETEFTGAPLLERLFLAGLNAVRHVALWLAEVVELLAEATVAADILANLPVPKPKPERKQAVCLS